MITGVVRCLTDETFTAAAVLAMNYDVTTRSVQLQHTTHIRTTTTCIVDYDI